jgi:hypothetical protein
MRTYSKNNFKKGSKFSSRAEHLPSKFKALSSKPVLKKLIKLNKRCGEYKAEEEVVPSQLLGSFLSGNCGSPPPRTPGCPL